MDNRQDARPDEAGIPESDETGLYETSNAQTESEPPAGVVPCEHSSTPSHMGASPSVNLSSVPPVLDLRPTTPPRGILRDWGGGESSSQADKRKGKGKEIAHDPAEAPGQCRLISLPPEIIDSILSFLSPIDLAFLSATCRLLYTHGTGDHLWQTIVQDHVPGIRVASPYPFESFYQLYKAHDPHWFLPKHKIWFSDGDLAGRLILTRYDQRRGCIEGYQLVAVSSRKNSEPWLADSDLEVMIHAFEPEVKLHLDKPILHLSAHRRDDRQAGEPASVGSKKFINLRSGGAIPMPLYPDNQGEASSGSKGVSADTGAERPSPRNRFQAEVSMESGTMDNAYCNLILARPVNHAVVAEGSALPFPYGNIWPPPVIPAQQRAVGCGVPNNSVGTMSLVIDKPTSRQELSDQIFRIRKGLHMRIPSSGLLGGREPTLAEAAGWAEVTNGGPAALLSMILPTPLGLNIGEAVSTYSTLDPALYTPTPEKPFRGIWVGDYSGHGCEFLLIHQPDDTPENAFDPDSVQRREDESDEQFEKRKHDEMVYRGRLEAIKLTGDPNVPRGEYTFVADDIGEGGFVTVVQHEPFTGTRVVKSKGHIAHTGFIDGHYIESQLLLISHDRLAQYWVGWRHISFFERVDIDKFLVPE